MTDTLAKKQADRFRLLNALYEQTSGSTSKFVNVFESGTALGLSREETLNAMDYLKGEFLAEYKAMGGSVAITHSGIKEVEAALLQPQMPTRYFPPAVNIINVRTMVGSQIQQGTHSSAQTQAATITQNELDAIQSLVAGFRGVLHSLPLDADTKAEAEAELQTVEAQLRSSKPKRAILREALKTLRTIVEGVAANAVASGVLPLFAPLAVLLSG